MILDARCRHGLGIGDARVVPIDKHASILEVLTQKISWPEVPIAMCPCLEWVVIFTTGVQTMDENKTKEGLKFRLRVIVERNGDRGSYSILCELIGEKTSSKKGNSYSPVA